MLPCRGLGARDAHPLFDMLGRVLTGPSAWPGQSADQAKLGKMQASSSADSDKASKLEGKIASGDSEMDRVINEHMFSLYCIWAESKLIRVSASCNLGRRHGGSSFARIARPHCFQTRKLNTLYFVLARTHRQTLVKLASCYRRWS